MKYLRYFLLVSLLVFAGASCRLQQPEPVEAPTNESSSSQALKAENDRLKKENERLKNEQDQMKDDKEDSAKEDEETKDENESDTKENNTDDSSDEDKNLNDRGREVVGDIPTGEDLGENRIDILVVSEELGMGSEDPAFKFGCDNYLYGLSINLEDGKSQSDLATAIVQLLTYKPTEEEGMNAVRGKGFILANVTYEDGVRIIELEGEDITSAGTCEDARIKAQMEETIAIYSDNFEIRLNGSAQEWEDLFSEQG